MLGCTVPVCVCCALPLKGDPLPTLLHLLCSQIGMHFMNPVPIMALVELAKGLHTSQQTFEACKGLAEYLGKQVATSQDRPVSGHSTAQSSRAWGKWVVRCVLCLYSLCCNASSSDLGTVNEAFVGFSKRQYLCTFDC